MHIKHTIDNVVSFIYNQPDKFKLLGINSHFKQNIEKENLKLSQFWFAKYLHTSSSKDEAEVTVFFRVFRRSETLDQGFLSSQMCQYNSEATHLVQEVVYGTEILCSMSRAINKVHETKENAEKNIYLAAKRYFDRAIGPNSINSCTPPAELNNVSCTVLSTLESGYNTKGLFPLFSGWLQNIVNNENYTPQKWRAVEIVLRPFPKTCRPNEEESRQAVRNRDDNKKRSRVLDDGVNFRLVNGEYPSSLRISEYFTQNKEYSQLIQQGKPDIYLLNAHQGNSADEDIRWFDIGRRDGASYQSSGIKNHKVIILMGATGCGKSTLINGMVNYILGVRWDDPFRFKCVREDESASQNQANSQTRSVTAYTIHHKEGMVIPHSVTIIDTPGYGDTTGIERDKKITKNIQQFLMQKDAGINEIHAACFVAASGDSRLTVTQRYILDSVLSIFGKDFRDNIRLLVTFADNADPPVIEACRAAHFPTMGSGRITYSKFNSSVLYAPNQKILKDEELYFDELFWDMGQENFAKFFKMLERMTGRDLKSTREVVELRQRLEESLDDIEGELEICLVTIENIDMFLEKMKQYDRNMDANKNFVMEKTLIRQTKVNCLKGFKAHNCLKCNKTCAAFYFSFSKKYCPKCKCPETEHRNENFEWRLVKEKVKTTLMDMKNEYEINYVSKMGTEQLIDKCLDDLELTKVKVISLLENVEANGRSLDSTALRSNALSPADYLSLMRSRVAEQQAPGYSTRLETLNELQKLLNTGATATEKIIRPNASTDRRSRERINVNQLHSTSNHYIDENKVVKDTDGKVRPHVEKSTQFKELGTKLANFFGMNGK